MCVEDIAIGRHTRVRTSTLTGTGLGVRVSGDVRRLAVAVYPTAIDVVVISTPETPSGQMSQVAGVVGTGVPGATTTVGTGQLLLHIRDYGQLVMGDLLVSTVNGEDVVLVEVLADDELDAKVNDFWDRMWRVKGG